MNKKIAKLAEETAKNLKSDNVESYGIHIWKQLQKSGGTSKLDGFINRVKHEMAGVDEIPVRIISARELSKDEGSQIIKQLERKTGKKIIADFTIDEGLIGGVIIKTPDQIIDASWRGKLDQLKTNLVGVV